MDLSNLSHAISVADEINKNPNDFVLLSVLTSFIQIGDLLVLHGKITAVMVLRERKVNDLIRDFLNSFEKEGKDITDEELEENLMKILSNKLREFNGRKEKQILQ